MPGARPRRRYARAMLPRRPAARLFLGAFALVALVHLVAQLAGADTVADADPGAADAVARRRALVRDLGAARPAGHPGAGRARAVLARRQRPQAGRRGCRVPGHGRLLPARAGRLHRGLPAVPRPQRAARAPSAAAALRRRRRRAGRRLRRRSLRHARAGARLRRLPGHDGRAVDRGQPAHRRGRCALPGLRRADRPRRLRRRVRPAGAGLLGDGHLRRGPGAHRRRRAASSARAPTPTPTQTDAVRSG